MKTQKTKPAAGAGDIGSHPLKQHAFSCECECHAVRWHDDIFYCQSCDARKPETLWNNLRDNKRGFGF